MDTSSLDLSRAAYVSDAIASIDWVLSSRFVSVTKALDPLNKKDLVRISQRLAASIRGITGPEEARSLAQALRTLDVDWNSLERKAQEAVIESAKSALRDNLPKRVLPRVAKKIDVGVKGTYSGAKRQSIATHKLDIPFTMSIPDTRIANHVSESAVNFIRDQYGVVADNFASKVRGIVADGAKRGASTREIVADLKKSIPDLNSVGRSSNYWEIASLAWINRSRTYAQLSGFKEAGFQRYVWESVLDEVTTETCRFMHGKTFPIAGAMNTFNAAEQFTDDPERLKEVQPWISQGVHDETKEPVLFFRNPDGSKNYVATINSPGRGEADRVGSYSAHMTDAQLLGNGISLPPIHGLCRSMVLPDISAPPRTVPARVPATAVPPTGPKPGKPRKPRAAVAAVPKLGEHYEHFISDLDAAIEAEAMAAIGDCGALPVLKKSPLSRIVFTSEVVEESAKMGAAIDRGANGCYYYQIFNRNETLNDRGLIKILSKRTGEAELSGSLSVAGPAPWSTSTALRRPVDQIRATMIHETGHHVHMHDLHKFVGMKTYRKKQVASFVPLTNEAAEIDGLIRSAYRRNKIAITKKKLLPITQYAQKNHKEFFAEAFAYHAIAPDTLKQRNPIAFEMVEQVRSMLGMDPVNAARMATIEKQIAVAILAKADPDWAKLESIDLRMEILFNAGDLTLEKIDELANEAAKAAGPFDDWRESFAWYRDLITMPERRDLRDAAL